MDPNKPGHESFDEFIRRLYTGQRGIPFNLDYSIPAKNYQLPYTRRNDPVMWHVNCGCDITPPLSIEDRLQQELAFDESRLILKKIAGYDVGNN